MSHLGPHLHFFQISLCIFLPSHIETPFSRGKLTLAVSLQGPFPTSNFMIHATRRMNTVSFGEDGESFSLPQF